MNRDEADQHATESLLPLQDLLELLQEQQKTGSLRAYLSTLMIQKRTIKGMYMAQITVDQGKIRSCSISQLDTEQILLEGAPACNVLQDLRGEVKWLITFGRHSTWSESVPSVSSKSHTDVLPIGRRDVPLSLSQRTPIRSRAPTSQQLALMTRQQRNVLRLVDGQRKVGQIASLLSLSEADVENILRDIASYALIIFH